MKFPSEFKTTVNIPWGSDYIDSAPSKAESLFSSVPLIYRAVRLRCNSLAQVPVYVYESGSEKLLDEYPFEDSLPLSDWLWLQEAAILLKGGSCTLIQRNAYSRTKGLRWLNPFTIEIDVRSGRPRFSQRVNGQRYPTQKEFWTEAEIIFLREFSPIDDLGFGVSACEVATKNAKMMDYITRFASNFFEYGAMPITVASIPGNPQPAERERFETKLKSMISGVKNAFRVLATTGEVKWQTLTPELDTLALEQLDIHAVNNIAWAFDIPKTLLSSDSANFATAGVEYRNFVAHTISARTKFYESKINRFLKDFGCRIEFAIEELSEMQMDEANRAASVKALVDSGVPLEAALDILGYDLSDEAEKKVKEAEKKKEERANKPVPTNGAVVPINGQGTRTDGMRESVPPMKALDLRRWEVKALNALSNGKSPAVQFVSNVIENEEMATISARLLVAQTEAEVKGVFQCPG